MAKISDFYCLKFHFWSKWKNIPYWTSWIWIYPLVNQHNYGKSPFLVGKSTISMVIFNSKLLNYQKVIMDEPLIHVGKWSVFVHIFPKICLLTGILITSSLACADSGACATCARTARAGSMGLLRLGSTPKRKDEASSLCRLYIYIYILVGGFNHSENIVSWDYYSQDMQK